MNDFKIGDEVLMIDVIFRRCSVINNPFPGELDLQPLDSEIDNESYRVIDKRRDAIDIIIRKLEELKTEP